MRLHDGHHTAHSSITRHLPLPALRLRTLFASSVPVRSTSVSPTAKPPGTLPLRSVNVFDPWLTHSKSGSPSPETSCASAICGPTPTTKSSLGANVPAPL